MLLDEALTLVLDGLSSCTDQVVDQVIHVLNVCW
jgi:hypothetical protein